MLNQRLLLVCLILGCKISVLQVFGQERTWQFNLGYNPIASFDFAGSIGIEKQLNDRRQFTLELGYNGYDYKNQDIIISDSDTTLIFPGPNLTVNYMSLLANWYPIKSQKQPYSLIYLGMGPAYFDNKYNKNTYHAGPGLRAVVGVQYLFFNRLSLRSNFDYIIYYITNRDRSNRFGNDYYYFNIVLGYRFGFKK